jgi:hypothetical protein
VIPRKLPVVNLDGQEYFFDLRLSQLRKVCAPHDFVDLSSDERRDFVESLRYLSLIIDQSGSER